MDSMWWDILHSHSQCIGDRWIHIGQFTKNADFDFSENLFETVQNRSNNH